MTNVLTLQGVSKRFGTVKALEAYSLEVRQGEVFTLLGPSGCGKTTTLRLVAGLENPDSGEIHYAGMPIVSVARRLFTPPHKRNMGMVFQSYALWPHMTVYENVSYPLRLRRVSSGEARKKVREVLDLVGLTGLEDRPAPMLSGGQQQRVALARALVYQPALLLLDEPFSNLDAQLREQMRVEVKLLQKKVGVTVLFVTHDQIEALSLSDRIGVMTGGRLEQIGTPAELYRSPATPFVRDFLGKTVVLRGKVTNGAAQGQGVHVGIEGIDQPLYSLRHSAPQLVADQEVHVAIRPEDITVNRGSPGKPGQNVIPGVLQTALFVGDRHELHVRLGSGATLFCYASGREKLAEGQDLELKLPEESITVWP